MSAPAIPFLVARAAIAAALLVAAAARPHAADPPARDPAAESREVHRFSRSFSSPTRGELASLQYLLTSDELTDLLSMRSEQSCRRWMEQFWWNRDPILTTPENEARQEHDRRVEIATSWFARGDWPGWDQRGEICIRYGLPPARSVESADVTPHAYVRPVEYWFYPALGMTIQFEDAFGNGSYTYFLERVELPTDERFSSDRMRMPAGQWQEMPDLDLDLMAFDAVLGVSGGFFGMSGPGDMFDYEDFRRSLLNFPAVLEKSPVVYPFDYAVRRLAFDFEVALFRAGDGVDRVDVNAEFVPTGNAAGEQEYRATAVFFDGQAAEAARLSHVTKASGVSAAAESLFTMVVQLPFTLAPAPYQVAITVEELGTGRFTSMRKAVLCDDFERNLALSTVCFSSRIEPAARPSAFTRGALDVVPRPSACYDVATSVPVYFEVYNLGADDQGAYRYTVSYRVIPITPAPRGLWKKLVGGSDESASLASSFESIANGAHDVVYLFLNTDHLWPGDFELDVTVVDHASRRETNRRGVFHLIQ